jgi:hypothetical protein
MKQLTRIFTALVILIFAAGSVQAQEAENPTLIVSSQKVKMSDMGAANKIVKDKISPILNGLVDEGMLFSWGVFTHAWGDEWNFNVWYVAKDMAAFNTFWDEYMKRLEQEKEAWAELRGYIQEHKDNIYQINNQYPAPPQR